MPCPGAVEEPDRWWSAYREILGNSGIGRRSVDVVGADAEHIVTHGVLGVGDPSAGGWPVSRQRRRLVMGAVQSGKTASMMAVAAKSLDRGVDAVVILGGTRTALWLQTFERVVEQLDTGSEPHLRRVLLPTTAVLEGQAAGSPADLYPLTAQLARRAVLRRRPLVAVVMKQVAHLEQMAVSLTSFCTAAEEAGRPFHLLVMDDEADDSSVADDSDSALVQRKQVPRRILDLWEARSTPGETRSHQLYATYLAYTATPQANFLQDPANPLAPRDFVASLRTPGPEGDVETRTTSYRVPEGATAWYTGGEVFYRLLADAGLCVASDEYSGDSVVHDAVRAYLVACAVRIARREDGMGPARAASTVFDDSRSAAYPPMSMLIHPSAQKEEHFEVARRLLAWTDGVSSPPSRNAEEGQGRLLGLAGIQEDMEFEKDRWLYWLSEYARSATVCHRKMSLSQKPEVLSITDWHSVRGMILDDVLPVTRIAVINSDEQADDRPRFHPYEENGRWWAPRDISTIFVSGNVMSRGLTLEGLSTTVFSRVSGNPLADTQMQMQRWFGYRGRIIDLCRVFADQAQLDLFAQYHDNDEALRRDVLAAMSLTDGVPDIAVLQGKDFSATGKVANVRGMQLSPGPRPFVTRLTPPAIDDENTRMVAGFFAEGACKAPLGQTPRGLVSSTPLSLTAAAELLERFRYPDHGGTPVSSEVERRSSLAHHAGLESSDPSLPLYRPPRARSSVDRRSVCPYSIAAYLRYWAVCLDRRVPGLVTTDEPSVPWSLVDLDQRSRSQPRFWVGIRFGRGGLMDVGPLAALGEGARSMSREHIDETIRSTWGSRGAGADGIVGDEHFESEVTGTRAETTVTGARVPGSDGLILLHPVDRGDGMVSFAIGASIPLGGG